MIPSFFAVGILALASAAPVPYTNCGKSSDLLDIHSVTAEPWPPIIGQELSLDIDATLKEDVNGGVAKTTVKIGFLKVFSDQKELDVAPAGPFKRSNTMMVSDDIPKGKTLKVHMTSTSDTGAAISCIDFNLTPKAAADLEAEVSLCENVKDEQDCLTSVEADNEECVWCVSAAVPSACYNSTFAQRLPGSIFKCDSPQSSIVTELVL